MSSTQKGRGGITFLFVSIAALAAVSGAIWLMRGSGDGLAPRSAGADPVVDSLSQNVGESRREATPPTAIGEGDARESATGTIMTDQASEPAIGEPRGTDPNATITAVDPVTTEDDPKPAEQSPEQSPEQPVDPQTDQKADEKADQKADEKPAERLTPPYFGNGFNGAVPGLPKAEPPATAAQAKLSEGLSLAATEPVKARLLLSQALLGNSLDEAQSRQAADALSHLSAQLFLTPVYNANDPICTQYTIQPNDSLEKIVRRNKCGCDWRLVARMNNIKNPRAIQVGKRLKLPTGPFSAVVSKRDYRIYICAGSGDDRVVIASLAIGLGEANGTPTGAFKVRANSKLINPEWIHPVTGQRFEADDPANPIGEHWLGLEGTEPSNAALLGYGIHGTIDPDSIGHDRSLGCIRLLSDDVALVWESLAEGSEVVIWPGTER